MSWANCGKDKQGRNIGYANNATCDHDGCEEKIDRGLSYACGDMHGETEYGCDKYFCESHRSNVVDTNYDQFIHICDHCKQVLIESEEWKESEDTGDLIRSTTQTDK